MVQNDQSARIVLWCPYLYAIAESGQAYLVLQKILRLLWYRRFANGNVDDDDEREEGDDEATHIV